MVHAPLASFIESSFLRKTLRKMRQTIQVEHAVDAVVSLAAVDTISGTLRSALDERGHYPQSWSQPLNLLDDAHVIREIV